MKSETQVQIVYEAVRTSLRHNDLQKGIGPSFSSLYWEQIVGFLVLVWQSLSEKV